MDSRGGSVVRVVQMTSVHPAWDNRIFHKECKSLAGAGYSVTLVAPHSRDEYIDEVSIRAVPPPKGRLERLFSTLWKVYRVSSKADAAIYHFHDPELILIGLLLRAKGKVVFYDVHEDVPKQIMSKHWIAPPLRRSVALLVRLMERLTAELLNGVVTATPSIGRKFPVNKTVTVQNYPRLDEVPVPTTRLRDREPIVAYVGHLEVARGTKEIVLAIDLLPASLGAVLELGGKFARPDFEMEVRRLAGWKKVVFKGFQSREGVADMLSRARIGLATLHPVPNYVESLPTKIFEYMAAGIPVVCSDFGVPREIIRRNQCGLLVDPLDPQSIAQAIEWLLTHPEESEEMGRLGRRAVEETYDWSHESAKLLDMYARALA